MSRSTFPSVVPATIAAILPNLIGSTSLAVVPEYSILDLGTPGGNRSEAFGVNNAGQVVGWGKTATGGNRAFLTAPNAPINPATNLIPLGTGATQNFAYGINASGAVAGDGNSPSGDRAFRYSAGTVTSLGTLGGGWSYANAINSLGHVVGGAGKPKQGNNFPTRPYIAIGSTLTEIPALSGTDAYAYGINTAGRVIGYSQLNNFSEHAFLWIPNTTNGTAGTTTDIGTLGGSNSYAWGINDAGRIVGGANTTNDAAYHAYVFIPTGPTGAAGTKTDLGTLGGASSEARAINTAGHIVGYADTAAGASHAFLHDGSGMYDLNAYLPAGSGWELKTARAINDVGQIVGNGTSPSGESHGFLLTPKPTWSKDANGDWSGATNWIGALPSGAGAEAQFTTAITAPRTVNVNTPTSLGALVFRSPVAYTLAGPQTLTIFSSIDVREGTHTIAAPLDLSATASVTLAAGAGLKLAGPVTGAVAALSLSPGSSLDLASNDLTLAYTGPTPVDTVREHLFASRIVSSVAAADPDHELALTYIDNGSTIILTLATLGDANLDDRIDADDFALIDRGLATAATGWASGDFDHSGVVDQSDYLLIDRVFGQQSGTLSPALLTHRTAQFGPDYVVQLVASVPEPAAAIPLFALSLMIRRRRGTVCRA